MHILRSSCSLFLSVREDNKENNCAGESDKGNEAVTHNCGVAVESLCQVCKYHSGEETAAAGCDAGCDRCCQSGGAGVNHLGNGEQALGKHKAHCSTGDDNGNECHGQAFREQAEDHHTNENCDEGKACCKVAQLLGKLAEYDADKSAAKHLNSCENAAMSLPPMSLICTDRLLPRTL